MHGNPAGGAPGGAMTFGGLATVQVLLDLKGADSAATTAAGAIRGLLGLVDRLADIRRRSLHEFVLRASAGVERPAPLSPLFSAYLERTAIFWNPNRQIAWVRIDGAPDPDGAWEVLPGAKRKRGAFGRPDLERPEYDHLLIWPRGRREVPADFGHALSGWDVEAVGQGELWSLRWREGATAEERAAWTRAVGAARSRREGLLFNPHAQDHRVFRGVVPIPLWSGGLSEPGGTT